MCQSGIYQIINLETNHSYIGSAKNLAFRWYFHKWQLNKQKHHSLYLQRAWNKYGSDAFEFKVLLYCSVQELLIWEQQYLDELNPEYNVCKIAGSRIGVICSEAAKQKQSVAMCGRKQTPEHIENARITRIGKKHTLEHIEKIRLANIGRICSDETKKKISESKKGCVSPNLGKSLSEEWRQNISIARKGKSTKKKGAKQVLTRGENNAAAKLTETQAIEILSYKQHLTLSECASQYNVTRNCIKDLRLRKSWTHLPFSKQKSPRPKKIKESP